MKSIFKTGTFLTASNLNLAQLASGLSGIIKGCDVVYQNNYLYISEGVIKFDDGTIVQFDGSETIDVSDLIVGKKYQVVAIKYSDYSLTYSIVDSTPEYSYIKLADVILNSNNSIDIVNSYKSSVSSEQRVLDFNYISAYLKDTEGVTISETASGVKYFKLEASASSVQYVWRDFKIGFVANSDVSSISIKGSLSKQNKIEFILKINGSEDYESNISGNNIADSFSLVTNPTGTDDVDFVFGVPYGKVKKNSKCQLVMRLFNRTDATTEADLYSITIN